MDISHLLLGRPWEYDRKVMHSGADNTYQFTWNTHKILLILSKDTAVPLTSQPTETPTISRTPSTQSKNLICSYASFISELRSEGRVFALIPSSPDHGPVVQNSPSLAAILNEFEDVFPKDLPTQLPPL